jgi:hypothetical protein
VLATHGHDYFVVDAVGDGVHGGAQRYARLTVTK